MSAESWTQRLGRTRLRQDGDGKLNLCAENRSHKRAPEEACTRTVREDRTACQQIVRVGYCGALTLTSRAPRATNVSVVRPPGHCTHTAVAALSIPSTCTAPSSDQ